MCSVDWTLLVEYLKVFLSWPPILLLIVICLVRNFRAEIGRLIDRVRRLSGGGAAVDLEVQRSDVAAAVTKTTLAEGQEGGPSPVQATPALGADHAETWEFRYLNYFFVWKTQLVLNAIAAGQIKSVSDFQQKLAEAGIAEPERSTIMNVLILHGLLEGDGAELKLTDKGQRYVENPERIETVALRVRASQAAIAAAGAPSAGTAPSFAGFNTGIGV
jgi:hypothetical protein